MNKIPLLFLRRGGSIGEWRRGGFLPLTEYLVLKNKIFLNMLMLYVNKIPLFFFKEVPPLINGGGVVLFSFILLSIQ